MKTEKKEGRYQRIYSQLEELLSKRSTYLSRLATVAAVLSHKMDYFFWTGFYLLSREGELYAGPYQGPVACQHLEKGKGVCWAGIMQEKTLIVPDVEQFPGHIACDSRSRSEIVIPIRNKQERIIGVLDVDSSSPDAFCEVDARWLEKILQLI